MRPSPPEPGGTSPSPESLVVQTELDPLLRAAPARLPPRAEAVLILRIVLGLTVADVAALVGSTPGSVRVVQHRALAQLRLRPGADALRGRADRCG